MYLEARLDQCQGLPRRPEEAPGYCILGASGRGKTHLAAAILRHWIETRRAAVITGDRWENGKAVPRYNPSAAFCVVPEMLMKLRASFGQPANRENAPVDSIWRLAQVRGLVLDDLGAEKATDWASETLYALINRRVSDLLPTVVTTNLSLKEIHERDPRLASRLAGLSVLTMDGPDRRLDPPTTAEQKAAHMVKVRAVAGTG